jgi:hypothetical protein
LQSVASKKDVASHAVILQSAGLRAEDGGGTNSTGSGSGNTGNSGSALD